MKGRMKRVRATLIGLGLVLALALAAPALVQWAIEAYYPRNYQAIVEREAEEFSLDPALVYAVIKCESGFDADAVSHAEALGLMQLTRRSFDWMAGLYPPENGGADPLDPEDNIHCGCALLRLLLNEFHTEREALAAYNAGMGNVESWLDDPRYSSDGETLTAIPYPETGAYVRKVLNAREMYRRVYR